MGLDWTSPECQAIWNEWCSAPDCMFAACTLAPDRQAGVDAADQASKLEGSSSGEEAEQSVLASLVRGWHLLSSLSAVEEEDAWWEASGERGVMGLVSPGSGCWGRSSASL
mmetsp:Transcript_74509/g.155325  ORF Transcript_74509/g.155325 Transcript_74509/m.155325 type:complete len:111 (+) Transcript_74509:552-884(+)